MERNERGRTMNGTGVRFAAGAGARDAGPGGSETNPYAQAISRRDIADPGEALVEKLTTAECWRLLEQRELGRLALDGIDGKPDVFPVNYLVHNGNVFIRSAPGSKLVDIAANPAAAFEVDGEFAAFRWSVIIRGTAHRLDVDAEIHESGVLDLTSWSPTGKHNFVRITPTLITGRRFRRRLPDIPPQATSPIRHTGRPGAPTTSQARGADARGKKPVPIPHFAPGLDQE